MIQKIPKPRKRPYWASKYVWDKTKSLVLVPLFGHHYEIPVTETTAPILSLLDGSLDPWNGFKARRSEFRRRNGAEDGLRDIINALYNQIEAVAVAGAAQMMAQDIQHKLEPLIRKNLHERVETTKARLSLDSHERA
jgi:hypothetical protein